MSTRRATVAGAGTNHAAQLLAYKGPVTERKASEYPVSTPYTRSGKGPVASPEYTQLVSTLQATLAGWAPMVQAAYQRHIQSGASIQTESDEALWRDYTQAYLTLKSDMDDKYTNMTQYVTPQNYKTVLAERQNNINQLLIDLIIGNPNQRDARVRLGLLKQAIAL